MHKYYQSVPVGDFRFIDYQKAARKRHVWPQQNLILKYAAFITKNPQPDRDDAVFFATAFGPSLEFANNAETLANYAEYNGHTCMAALLWEIAYCSWLFNSITHEKICETIFPPHYLVSLKEPAIHFPHYEAVESSVHPELQKALMAFFPNGVVDFDRAYYSDSKNLLAPWAHGLCGAATKFGSFLALVTHAETHFEAQIQGVWPATRSEIPSPREEFTTALDIMSYTNSMRAAATEDMTSLDLYPHNKYRVRYVPFSTNALKSHPYQRSITSL